MKKKKTGNHDGDTKLVGKSYFYFSKKAWHKMKHMTHTDWAALHRNSLNEIVKGTKNHISDTSKKVSSASREKLVQLLLSEAEVTWLHEHLSFRFDYADPNVLKQAKKQDPLAWSIYERLNKLLP